MHRTAIVTPALLVAGAAALLGWQLVRDRQAPVPQLVSVPVAAPPPVQPLPPRPPQRAEPVGNFLGWWGKDLALGSNDGPPLLFVLDAAALKSARHGWKLPKLAQTMADELARVLDEGCGRDAAQCSAAATHARDAARELADTYDYRDGEPRLAHWQDDDAGVTMWHRSFAIRRSAGAVALDVTCESASWTVGMRMWNDIGTCEGVLTERGQVIARYSPRVVLADNKEGVFELGDGYMQIVALADDTMVTITTYATRVVTWSRAM
jgi:hypothetical protein